MEKALLKKLDEGLTAAKSIAESLDKLVNEPLVQIEPSPPQCPHCGVINPQVQIDQSSAKGKIVEFVLECICGHCGRDIYGIVTSWNLQPNRSSAIQAATQIVERSKNGGSKNS